MDMEQHITLTLTASEASEYCIEMYEALGLLEDVDGGNTRTGLVTMRKLRDLLEKHGLGIRLGQLESEVAYLRDTRQGPDMTVPHMPYVPANGYGTGGTCPAQS